MKTTTIPLKLFAFILGIIFVGITDAASLYFFDRCPKDIAVKDYNGETLNDIKTSASHIMALEEPLEKRTTLLDSIEFTLDEESSSLPEEIYARIIYESQEGSRATEYTLVTLENPKSPELPGKVVYIDMTPLELVDRIQRKETTTKVVLYEKSVEMRENIPCDIYTPISFQTWSSYKRVTGSLIYDDSPGEYHFCTPTNKINDLKIYDFIGLNTSELVEDNKIYFPPPPSDKQYLLGNIKFVLDRESNVGCSDCGIDAIHARVTIEDLEGHSIRSFIVPAIIRVLDVSNPAGKEAEIIIAGLHNGDQMIIPGVDYSDRKVLSDQMVKVELLGRSTLEVFYFKAWYNPQAPVMHLTGRLWDHTSRFFAKIYEEEDPAIIHLYDSVCEAEIKFCEKPPRGYDYLPPEEEPKNYIYLEYLPPAGSKAILDTIEFVIDTEHPGAVKLPDQLYVNLTLGDENSTEIELIPVSLQDPRSEELPGTVLKLDLTSLSEEERTLLNEAENKIRVELIAYNEYLNLYSSYSYYTWFGEDGPLCKITGRVVPDPDEFFPETDKDLYVNSGEVNDVAGKVWRIILDYTPSEGNIAILETFEFIVDLELSDNITADQYEGLVIRVSKANGKNDPFAGAHLGEVPFELIHCAGTKYKVRADLSLLNYKSPIFYPGEYIMVSMLGDFDWRFAPLLNQENSEIVSRVTGEEIAQPPLYFEPTDRDLLMNNGDEFCSELYENESGLAWSYTPPIGKKVVFDTIEFVIDTNVDHIQIEEYVQPMFISINDGATIACPYQIIPWGNNKSIVRIDASPLPAYAGPCNFSVCLMAEAEWGSYGPVIAYLRNTFSFDGSEEMLGLLLHITGDLMDEE